MSKHAVLPLLAICFFTYNSPAQLSTPPGAQAVAGFPGPPKNPPFFSQITRISQRDLQYQNDVDMKGPVAAVDREDIQSLSQNPDAYNSRTTLKFDADGHLTESVQQNSLGVSTTSNFWVNGRLENQTVHHHRNDGKSPDWDEWQRWVYDKEARLSEFHAGRDKRELTTYVNFKYDSTGRSLGYELRGQNVTEISYEGKEIKLSRFQMPQHREFYEQDQVVDERNLVTDLRVSDLSGGQMNQWYHVTFKYDKRGRVIEQNTDPFKLGSGDDYSPLPGRLIVEYDDKNHSGEQKFYDTDGKLALHTTFEFDSDGVPTKLRNLDISGKQLTGGEIFVDPESRKSSIHPGNVEWEVSYDDHSNWTERRRWFTPVDGSPRIMIRIVRQTITYR